MSQSPFVNLPHLNTERLILRPMQPDDVQAVYDYASDPEVARYTAWTAHQSLLESRAFVNLVLEQYARGEPAPWGLVHRGDGKLIGTCGFVAMVPEHGRAELGYAMGRPYWGQGYMTEAARAVIAYAFSNLDLNRIEAMCDCENVASARVLEKCGMRFEGILRDYVYIKGYYRSVRMYAILREDWNQQTAIRSPLA
ncbi:MAG: GNAT family N-acetyltransferase [Anaerolineae bacterium]